MTTYYGPERPQVPHYRQGSIEPIDFVRSQGLGFCEGNVVKYVVRWRHKGGLGDLLKARDYLNWLIEDAQTAQSAKAMDELAAESERLGLYDPPAEPPRLVPRMVPDASPNPAYTMGAEAGTFIQPPAAIADEAALPAKVRERLRQDMNERY